MPTISCPPMRYQSNLWNDYPRSSFDYNVVDCFNACIGASSCDNPSATDFNLYPNFEQELKFNGDDGNSHIWRTGFFFDCTALNPDWIIESASLFYWISAANTGGEWYQDSLIIVDAPALHYPVGGSVNPADFGYLWGCINEIYAQAMDNDSPVTLTEMSIPAGLLSSIKPGGITSYGARTGRDVNGNSANTYNKYVDYWIGCQHDADSLRNGRLDVTYTTSIKNLNVQSRSIPATMISF